MGDRTPGGDVRTALGDGRLVLIRPRLIVFRCVREGLKYGVVTLGLNETQRRHELVLGQLVDQAMQLLPTRHTSMVPAMAPAERRLQTVSRTVSPSRQI